MEKYPNNATQSRPDNIRALTCRIPSSLSFGPKVALRVVLDPPSQNIRPVSLSMSADSADTEASTRGDAAGASDSSVEVADASGRRRQKVSINIFVKKHWLCFLRRSAALGWLIGLFVLRFAIAQRLASCQGNFFVICAVRTTCSL